MLGNGGSGEVLAEYKYLAINESATVTRLQGLNAFGEVSKERDSGYLQTTSNDNLLVATRVLDKLGRTVVLSDLVNKTSTGPAAPPKLRR